MNFAEWKILLTGITKQLVREKNDFLLLGGKDLEGRMKQRIFNKGKNTEEKPIGKYTSKWWIKVRKEGSAKFPQKGRQTSYVDLEYTGDLRNSIQVVKDGDGVALAIIDDLNFDKAMGQQLIQGKKAGSGQMLIFEPSKKEITGVQNYINDLIDERVEEIIQRSKP
jgi:hypothetical protein